MSPVKSIFQKESINIANIDTSRLNDLQLYDSIRI